MNFLPIAIRELQVTARKLMTYYWRSISAANAACITLAWLLVGFSGAVTASQAGTMTFQALSMLGYAMTAMASSLITCDCISEERREGTLGFLFLTDLKGYDIVVGKLARLAVPVYCLAAAFPALGFTMLLGGVELWQFAKIAVTLLNTLFFFSTLGLLISARVWNSQWAVSLASMGVLVFSAPMVAALLGLRVAGPGMPALIFTPAGAFLSALVTGASTVTTPSFWASLIVSNAMGWLFLILASGLVSRVVSGEKRTRPARAKLVSSANPALALFESQSSHRSWPFVMVLLSLVVLICVVGMWISAATWYDIPLFAIIVLTLHLVFKARVAQSACQSLPHRRQTGELEILLTTPLDGDTILLGSTTAIKHELLWPFFFVTAMDVLLLVLGWRKLGLWQGFAYGAVWLVEFVTFAVNLYTLTWFGLWAGMRTANSAKAMGRTIFCILFMPWTVVAVCAAGVGILTYGHFQPMMSVVTGFEFAAGWCACNLGFAGLAVCELRDKFRFLAASQTAPPKPFKLSWIPRWRKV